MKSSHTAPVKKSRQHHVWQEYLRAWSRDDKVYCLQAGRIFHTGTQALGIIKDFYKIENISSDDIKLLRLIAGIEKAHPLAREHHELLLDNILTPMLFVEKFGNLLNNPDEIIKHLDAHNTNAVDDYHTFIESSFVSLLPRVRSGDISWYDDDNDCVKFCMFIADQHMRTRGVKSRVIDRLNRHMNLDVTRIWDILALLIAFNIGCSLFLERKSRRLILVRNATELNFVTGDQPVLNLRAKGDVSPDALSLYYPISPSLSLYMEEPNHPAILNSDGINESAVGELNIKISSTSHSQIYAQSTDPLKRILCDLS